MPGNLMKGTMAMRECVHLFILMILGAALLPRVSSGRQLAGKLLDGVVEEWVDEMLLNCGLDVTTMKSFVKYLDISAMDGILTYSTQGWTWEVFSPSSPELKHTFLNCLSQHDVLFHVSGEHSPRNTYLEHSSFTASRRYLADLPLGMPPALSPAAAPVPVSVIVPVSELASAPSPGPGVETPKYGPSPSPGPGVETPKYGPSPSPGPGVETPKYGPPPSPSPGVETPKYGPPPSPDQALDPSPPVQSLVGTSSQISEAPSPDKGAVMPPENHKKKSVVVTAVLATAGTIILASFLICCCICFRKTSGSESVQKDDMPLLTASISGFSGSSTYKPGLNGPVHKDSVHLLTAEGQEESIASDVFSGIPTSTEASNASSNSVGHFPHLKPPPGRNMVSPSVPPPHAPPLPTLKPKPGPPPPPPPIPKAKPGPPPPPPSKASIPPRPPHAGSASKIPRPSPLGPNKSVDADVDAPKTKLKPLFWDKVSTNPDKSMVWNDIKSGSFQFNEEMIETLFGYRSDDKRKADGRKGSTWNDPSQFIQLLEPKKSQNLAISLKAMNVKISDVSDALMEGNELPSELLQTLLRMAPTTDEELKLRLYSGDPSLLGPGEQFLKGVMDIPFAFKRMDALLFINSLPEEVTIIKESFASLEVACKELRSSRLFLKILEAVLKLGNRMNDGTFRGGAQAFKLDTLLKLSDVKGADGKTTLLHFVVQEMIRSEGARAVRVAREKQCNSSIASYEQTDYLQASEDEYPRIGVEIVSCLSSELENVKKSAGLDADALVHTVAGLGQKLIAIKEFMYNDMKSTEEDSGFQRLLKSFIEHAEVDIPFLLEEEKRISSLVKSTTGYFQGNSGRDEGFRMFVVVSDFLGMIDKACKGVRESQRKVVQVPRSRDNQTSQPVQDPRQHLFPAIRDRRVDSSSSDDDES